MENESGEHGQAMFVLFSFGAIKQRDDKNHFSLKKKKKAVALLESVGEPSSDHEGELMQR